MFSEYYRDELTFIREMGPEFAKAHPGRFADALLTPEADPDVERLLQGFAFLTARVRERIEDGFPEIVDSLLGLLWPQFLRPVPSATVIQFEPRAGAVRGVVRVPQGATVQSVPIEGTTIRCRFQTCFDTDVAPIRLESAELRDPAVVRMRFRLEPDVPFEDALPSALRLFLGEGPAAFQLFDALSRLLVHVELRGVEGEGRSCRLDRGTVTFPGFEREHGLIRDPSRGASGLRDLLDYFVFPEKFLFVDLGGLEAGTALGITDRFEIDLVCSELPSGLERIEADALRLFASPAVNLFDWDARSFRASRERFEYPLIPDCEDPRNLEIFDVVEVHGQQPGHGVRGFEPMYAFNVGDPNRNLDRVFYRVIRRKLVDAPGTRTFLSLMDPPDVTQMPAVETISAKLSCTNGRLSDGRLLVRTLSPGDIREGTGSTPGNVTFRDITRITAPVDPPAGRERSWRLVSLLAMNLLSLASRDNLRTVLRFCDFRSAGDAAARKNLDILVDAIESVQVTDSEAFHRGYPVKGTVIRMGLHDRALHETGRVQLLGSVLDAFFASFATLNSFTQLRIDGLDSGEEFEWRPRSGHTPLL